MEISTFKEDLIGLKDFAEQMERFIKVEQRYVAESLVISLNAGFGSGKSTFFKMWKKQIVENNNLSLIEINAWRDDYYNEPFIPLISTIIEIFKKDDNKKKTELINKAKKALPFFRAVGNQIVNKYTGLDIQAAKDSTNKETSDSIFDSFFKKKEALKELKDSIKNSINNNQNILIFVDELDRCRPDYAISYLETIKHIFDIKGLTFILAVDRKQLEASAKAAFGAELNFAEYYRKFIHREIDLPKPEARSYERFASKYINFYLQKENERNCLLELNESRKENIVALINFLQITPRQLQEVFRIAGHVLETDETNKGQMPWHVEVGTILMAALKIRKPEIYRSLGNQNLSIKEAKNFLRQIGLDKKNKLTFYWWFKILYIGGGLKESEIASNSSKDIYEEAGFTSENDLAQFKARLGWDSEFSFKTIFSRIGKLSAWN